MADLGVAQPNGWHLVRQAGALSGAPSPCTAGWLRPNPVKKARSRRPGAPSTPPGRTPPPAGRSRRRARLAGLRRGGAPLWAALLRFWQRIGLLRAPVPLTGAAALSPEVPWDRDRWTPHFLRALAVEAEGGLDLLLAIERAWLAARAGVPARRSTSRAGRQGMMAREL